MDHHEKAVRDAAEALRLAIGEAEAAGYRIAWPHRAADLPGIGISETAASIAMKEAAAAAEKPKRRSKSADVDYVGAFDE